MVFVTGATGLLGSYLTKLLLAKGEQVRALRRKTSDLSLLGAAAQQVEWMEGDILDIPSLEDAMQGVEKVYHCAALISFLPSDANAMVKVNREGTANVMNVALYSGVKKVLHVSSEAAFGFPRMGKVIDESYDDSGIHKCPWYYRSKQYGEREAWRAHAEGLEVVIACPATIIGGGWWSQPPNLLFPEVDRGLWFYAHAVNGFVDVRDVTECIYRLMESDINGEKFLLVAENISLRDLVWMIADTLQVKRAFIPAGKWLMAIAWRVQLLHSWITRQPPILTKESASLTAIDFRYSNEKISRMLGYRFRPVKQTIEETAALYLKSKNENKSYGTFE